MNGNNALNGLPQIGSKPRIEIVQEQDKDQFAKTFNDMIIKGWQPSGVSHQMFYDEDEKKIVTCFLCVFTRTG